MSNQLSPPTLPANDKEIDLEELELKVCSMSACSTFGFPVEWTLLHLCLHRDEISVARYCQHYYFLKNIQIV